MNIDVSSKYGWGVPLKNKSGPEVSQALRRVLLRNKCKKLFLNSVREFYNKSVYKLCKDNDIEMYSTNNKEKCSMVEIWNRTIKTLWHPEIY